MGFCGPGSGIGDWLVPDSILGLYIGDICECHDKDYAQGFPRKGVDLVFYNRLILRVMLYGGLLEPIRLRIVQVYYLAVKYFGHNAWNKGHERMVL